MDAARGIAYLDLEASDGVECEKKFLTDSKIGRSTKERFRYWIDMRNPLPKLRRTQWAQITPLLSSRWPGLYEGTSPNTKATFLSTVAPSWIFQHCGDGDPIAVWRELFWTRAHLVMNVFVLLRTLYSIKIFLASLPGPKRKEQWQVQVSCGIQGNLCVLWPSHLFNVMLVPLEENHLWPHTLERTMFYSLSKE